MIVLCLTATFVTLAASAVSGACNEALTGIAMCEIEVSFDEPRMSRLGTKPTQWPLGIDDRLRAKVDIHVAYLLFNRIGQKRKNLFEIY